MKNRLFLKILFQFWDTRFFVPCVAFGSPWPPGRHCELKNCEKPMFFKQFDFAVPARNFCCYTQYFRPLAARRLLGAGRLGGPAEPNGRIWIEPGPRPRRCQGQQFLFRLLIWAKVISQEFLRAPGTRISVEIVDRSPPRGEPKWLRIFLKNI